MIKKQKNTKKIHLIALASFLPIFLILWGILLFVPAARGFASFPIKTVQCGNQPYIADGFASSRIFTAPGDKLYHGPTIFTQYGDYYCNEADILRAGYAPHLWKDVCEMQPHQVRSTDCYPGGDGFNAIVTLFSLVGVISIAFAYGVSLYANRLKK